MKTAKEFRALARENLKGHWGAAILASLIATAVPALLNLIPTIGSIASLMITGQLIVGEIIFYSKLNKKNNPAVKDLFEDFTPNFLNNLCTYLLMTLYLILWSFLFIVPAIIKAYSYSMTMYIKSVNPNIGHNEAITLSRKIMNGKKWRLFCLSLSFIGWSILSMLTLGIGLIWLAPYMQTATTAFYQEAYESYTRAA